MHLITVLLLQICLDNQVNHSKLWLDRAYIHPVVAITGISDKADSIDKVDVSKIVDIFGIIEDDCLIQKMLLKILKGQYGILKN